MVLRGLGEPRERRLQHDRRDPPLGGEMHGDGGAQRLAVEDHPVRPDPLALEKPQRRLCVGVKARLARGPGVAAIAAIFEEQHAVALAGKSHEALGAIADIAAIAVKIRDDRTALRRRPIPGEQIEPVGGRHRGLAGAERSQRPDCRPARVRQVEQAALEHEQPGEHDQIGGQRRPSQGIGHVAWQFPGQAAGSATRSDRRNLTLADLSWPQAARMSRPRGVRTGAE